MKNNDDLEKRLSETPAPGVQESHHKMKLKNELITNFAAPHRKEVTARPMKWQKIAIAAVCAVIVLATAGWAYNHYRQIEVTVTCEDGVAKAVVTDDEGTREYELEIEPTDDGIVMIKVGEDGVPRQVDGLSPEIKDALKSGTYIVTEEDGTGPDGEEITFYNYKFSFDDGREIELKVPYRLEEVVETEEE